MKEILYKTWNYLFEAGIATLTQLITLLGPLLLFAVLMNFIARKSELLGYKVLGQKIYLYVFGWLGTSVHELGHAVFALVFAHKISEIKLFSPRSGKSLGHVKHSYKSGNPYQTIGNFFIGLGPILLGMFLLFLFSWFLFGFNIFGLAEKHGVVLNLDLFNSMNSVFTAALNTGKGVWEFVKLVFTGPESNWWKIILFLYFFYAVGSSITLSSADIKGAFRGFFYFLILLFIFNIATIWTGNFTLSFFQCIANNLSGFYFLIIVSLGLNVIFIVILYLFDLMLSLFPNRKPKGKSKS